VVTPTERPRSILRPSGAAHLHDAGGDDRHAIVTEHFRVAEVPSGNEQRQVIRIETLAGVLEVENIAPRFDTSGLRRGQHESCDVAPRNHGYRHRVIPMPIAVEIVLGGDRSHPGRTEGGIGGGGDLRIRRIGQAQLQSRDIAAGEQLQLPVVGGIENARDDVAARTDDILGESGQPEVGGIDEQSPRLLRGAGLDGLA